MWPDNETADDLLGFRVHADLIRAVVTNSKTLPTTIGVFGDWGGGKTSIMKMLEKQLDPESHPARSKERAQYEKIAVIYFNTWLFDGYDDAKAAILSSILIELGEHKRFGPKIRDSIVSLLKSVNWMRLLRLGFKHVAIPGAAALLTGGVAAVPAAVAISTGLAAAKPEETKKGEHRDKEKDKEEKINWEELIQKDPKPASSLDVRDFRKRFEKLLKDSDISSLVILVDDLDRCTPDRIVDNLEAIKLFLNVERTAFIIGADPRIVSHAIRARYAERAIGAAHGSDSPSVQDQEDSERLVKDYLEKVVQIPYHLPRLSAAEIETYMVLLFCNLYLDGPELKNCLDKCEKEREKNRYSTFGPAGVHDALKPKQSPPELTAALTLCASAAPLIAEGLKGNPRQVKRFLNALLLRKELARVAKLENIRDDVLIKLMILEYAHDKLFAELFEWQAQQNGHPKEIADLESSIDSAEENLENEETIKKTYPHWSTSRVRKWLTMEPHIASFDLRDYFWVARDKLATTFSGITMVPPAVRAVLDGLLSGNVPKRNAALGTVLTLTEDERAHLLTLLSQQVSRLPREKIGYDAIRYLIEKNLPGASELLADILSTKPLEHIPRTIGMDLANLLKGKVQLLGVFNTAMERLSESQTPIGRAYQSARKQ